MSLEVQCDCDECGDTIAVGDETFCKECWDDRGTKQSKDKLREALQILHDCRTILKGVIDNVNA